MYETYDSHLALCTVKFIFCSIRVRDLKRALEQVSFSARHVGKFSANYIETEK